MSKRKKNKKLQLRLQRKRRKTKIRMNLNNSLLLKLSGKKLITTGKNSSKLSDPTQWKKLSNGPKMLQVPNSSTKKISDKIN